MEVFLSTGRDTVLYAIPAIGLLMVGIFGLDEPLFRTRSAGRKRPAPRMPQPDGEPILTDPDGRVVKQRRGAGL